LRQPRAIELNGNLRRCKGISLDSQPRRRARIGIVTSRCFGGSRAATDQRVRRPGKSESMGSPIIRTIDDSRIDTKGNPTPIGVVAPRRIFVRLAALNRTVTGYFMVSP
jgi:hypothetical protein